jgi:Tol biopolymer transport system component
MVRVKALLAAGLAMGLSVTAAGPQTVPRLVWSDAQTNLLGAPSPDGRLLSFVDPRTGDLAVRDLASNASRRLTRVTPETRGQFAYFSTISPDSRLVAYAWFNEARFYELRVLAIDKPEPRVLFRNEESGFVQPCAWSPDGQWILTLFFRKDNISQIALVSAKDGSVRVLRSLNWVYPKKMDFSPDGRHIVYDNFARDGSNQRDIFVLSADGSRETVLVEHAANDLFPLWTRDGAFIYFASDRAGTMDAWRVAVAEGASSGTPELVRRDLGRYLPMGITRSGQLFYGVNAGSSDVFLSAIGGDGIAAPRRASIQFPGRNFAPDVSWDGSMLAFLSRRGTENYGQASRAITVRDLKDNSERELTPKLAHIESIAFSPDGRTLLAAGSDAKGRSGLFVVDLDKGGHRPLITDPDAPFRGYPAAWQDMTTVVYARGSELVRLSTNTLEQEVIGKAPSSITRVAASKSAIAYFCGSLFVMRDGKTEKLPVEGDVRSLGVRDDLVFAATTDSLWLLRSSGATRIAMPGEFDGEAAIFPGSRSVAFTAGRERQEVWVLEHARQAL